MKFEHGNGNTRIRIEEINGDLYLSQTLDNRHWTSFWVNDDILDMILMSMKDYFYAQMYRSSHDFDDADNAVGEADNVPGNSALRRGDAEDTVSVAETEDEGD